MKRLKNLTFAFLLFPFSITCFGNEIQRIIQTPIPSVKNLNLDTIQKDFIENQIQRFSVIDGSFRTEVYLNGLLGQEKRWLSLKPRKDYEGIFLRVWGRSNHYYAENPLKPQHEKNPGFGFEIEGGPGRLLPNEHWRLSGNFIKNTTGGPTGMGCLAIQDKFFEILGYSVSGGISSCLGLYNNQYAKQTIPLAGFFPTFSVRQGDGAAITFTLLPKNPLLPIGKQAAGIISADRPIETQGNQPSGALIFFEKRW